ncbi:MAG: CBS domain-containing protein [Haloferacaceae archaeon]
MPRGRWRTDAEFNGAATTESRAVIVDELLDGITVDDIASRGVAAVSGETTVSALGDRMLRDRQTVYTVTDESGATVGVVTLADLRSVGRAKSVDVRVTSVMREVPRVDVSDDAFETLARLNQAGGTTALVEERGDVVGVLSEADYAHALSVQREFRSGVTGKRHPGA